MPDSSTATILSITDPKITENLKSSNYSLKQWAKAGSIFAITTGAFLVLKTTGSFGLITALFKGSQPGSDANKLKLTEDRITMINDDSAISTTAVEETNTLTVNHHNSFMQDTKSTDLPRLVDFEELSLTGIKNSHEHVTFMPQKAKRNPTEIPEKVGPEFQVNTYTVNHQDAPSVAGLSDGKFVVTWQSDGQDGDGYGIYGQMFNVNGSKYSSEFQVNTYTANGQSGPSIAGLSDGKFVVTWSSGGLTSPYQDGDGYGTYGQMFNADGTKYSSEFQVHTNTTDWQYSPSTARLSNGKFVVTWVSSGQDGDGGGIYGQMFNADSSKFASEFQVNTFTAYSQSGPFVTGLSDGKFVVTWHGTGNGDNWGIYGQMFNTDGSKFASEFQINTYTTSGQEYPSVAGLSNGKFVVTWFSIGQDGDDAGVYGRMFNADGSKYSSEFQVNTYTTSGQYSPSVAELTDGKFVVTWDSYGQDGDDAGVYGQMFSFFNSSVSSLSEGVLSSLSTETNSLSVSSIKSLSPSEQSSSSAKISSSPISGVKSSLSLERSSSPSDVVSRSSSSFPDSTEVSSSYSSAISSLETSSSTTPVSSIKSLSPSEQSSSSAKISSSPISGVKSSLSLERSSSPSDVVSRSSSSFPDSTEVSSSYSSTASSLSVGSSVSSGSVITSSGSELVPSNSYARSSNIASDSESTVISSGSRITPSYSYVDSITGPSDIISSNSKPAISAGNKLIPSYIFNVASTALTAILGQTALGFFANSSKEDKNSKEAKCETDVTHPRLSDYPGKFFSSCHKESMLPQKQDISVVEKPVMGIN